MAQFFTNELVSLEKLVEDKREIVKTELIDIIDTYEIDKCTQWIKDNNFERVCLQFPDFMLPDSSSVAMCLQKRLGQTIYIMGDTSYESCCIDYITAAHVDADSIIHFGPKCLSLPSGDVPCLRINGKQDISFTNFKESFVNQFCDTANQFLIVLDLPYVHCKDQIKDHLTDFQNVDIKSVDDIKAVKDTVLYVGENNRKLMNFAQKHMLKNLYFYNPKANRKVESYYDDPKLMKRRYYLMEKIKDSKSVGIVIATLAIKNYLKVIERVKTLLKLCNKKYYVISVGKPTVAKLANFPEIELYVVISCAMNDIFDSRDFYQPLVTPYDVEMALNTNSDRTNFSYDFNSAIDFNVELNKTNIIDSLKNDVSLLTGKIRNLESDDDVTIYNKDGNGDGTVAIKSDGILAINYNYGAGYLNDRTWKGLEQNLGKNDVKLAVDGKKGIAQGYDNEGL